MEFFPMCLSDAIRLGSLLVPNPAAGHVERCAITMALKAIGALPENLDDPRSYRGDEWNQWNTLAYPERTLLEAYPWIGGSFPCHWCNLRLSDENVVSHPFDYHVMHGCFTPLDVFCDWVHSIDPHNCTKRSEAGAAQLPLKSNASLQRGPSLVPIASKAAVDER